MPYRGLFAGALCALLAAGCATVVPEAARPSRGAVSPEAFEVSGRFSARHDREGAAGHFAWAHAVDGDTLVFSTPTGQALARMKGDAGGVRVELPDGRTESAVDWEALTSQVLGVPIPVRGLASWVLALPRPGSDHREERDAQGRVSLLRQDGWEIVYGYGPEGEVARLRMTYPDVDLRLALDEWR